MRSLILKTIGVVIIVLFSACNFPRPGQPAAILTVTAVPKLVSVTDTVEPSQDYVSTECAFVWANDPLPKLSQDFDTALKAVQPEAKGYAQAYGENCVTNDGDVVRFLAMQTDFYITLQVEDLEDKQVLGELVEQSMEVLSEFPTDETPGPQPGYVAITFEAPENSLRLWVTRTEVEIELENGLRGEELFKALQSK